MARRAVDRVAQPGTGLRDLWSADDESGQAWTGVVDGLRTRLTP